MPSTLLNSSKRRCKLYYDFMAATIRARDQARTPLEFFDYVRTEAYNDAITDVIHKIERSDDKDALIIEVSGMKKRFKSPPEENGISPYLKNTRVYRSVRRALEEERKGK